jgi:hypothetical protein
MTTKRRDKNSRLDDRLQPSREPRSSPARRPADFARGMLDCVTCSSTGPGSSSDSNSRAGASSPRLTRCGAAEHGQRQLDLQHGFPERLCVPRPVYHPWHRLRALLRRRDEVPVGGPTVESRGAGSARGSAVIAHPAVGALLRRRVLFVQEALRMAGNVRRVRRLYPLIGGTFR